LAWLLEKVRVAVNAEDYKRCAKCWRYLPNSDFGHDGRTRDHLTYRCNTCRSQPEETFTTTHQIPGDM
jgi:Pyruvate/2-oxoacid:ferredoxin oxidoreductase delta subunit